MMTPPIARLPVRALLALSPLLLLMTGSTGCASSAADLRLTSLENNAAFSQRFAQAYLTKGAEGNTQIVLVNNVDAPARAAGAALEPGGSVRHVMHVKVLWRPQRGAKQSHPSFTNAGIHWYVFSEGQNGAAGGVLEYSGAGYVALADAWGGTQVTIRNATLKPVATPTGSLNDPVGPTRLTGSFLATRSAARVNDVLAEVKNATGTFAQQASVR